MTATDPFWGVVGLLAIVVMAFVVVELWERRQRKRNDVAMSNTYLAEREKQNATDRLLTVLYPPTKKFEEQNARRKTTPIMRATHTTDGQKPIRTASKGRVN